MLFHKLFFIALLFLSGCKACQLSEEDVYYFETMHLGFGYSGKSIALDDFNSLGVRRYNELPRDQQNVFKYMERFPDKKTIASHHFSNCISLNSLTENEFCRFLYFAMDVDPMHIDFFGATPLGNAVQVNNIKILEFILNEIDDVNVSSVALNYKACLE